MTSLTALISTIVAFKAVMETAMKLLANIIQWIIQQESSFLVETFEFLIGKTFIEYISGRKNLAEIINRLYISLRFIVLGIFLAGISGAKVVLLVVWGVLFTTQAAFKVVTQ
jgi:hypothetical protein